MRYFIYFRNPNYAKILADKYSNSFIKATVSEIFGVDLIDDDIFIIDAHQGGEMSDLNSLEVAYKLIGTIGERNVKICILSWFSKGHIERNYQIGKALASSKKIEFLQLPYKL